MEQGFETLDDRRTTRASRQENAGIVVIFCAGAPAFEWGALEDGARKIGRTPSMGLVADTRLSREHAEIAFDGDRWTVRDLDSRNGTFIDGKRIEGAVTFDGAPRVIRMGHTIALPVVDGWSVVTARAMREEELVVGPRLRAAWNDISKIACTGRNVAITGESGSGKHLAAKVFHAASTHARGPFVAVSCASLPPGLAERLLFGAKKGAYAGANADIEGYVQSARGGVLFLDEFVDLDLGVQAKLLRLLETSEVLPLGSASPTKADVQLCFATQRDLRQAVADGKFRADLFYRVRQEEVAVPPLRDRLEEIPWHIAGEVARADGGLSVSAELVEACLLRAWPGNVRELLGEVRRAASALRGTPTRTLRPEHLSARAGMIIEPPRPPVAARSSSSDAAHPPRRNEITRERIEAAFRCLNNATAVARELGVHRSHLYRLMKQHGVVRVGDEP
jgi:DNA-binding NtrC family response regulator